MSPVLYIVLMLQVLSAPGQPSITVGYYETVKDCQKAAQAIDESTPLILKLTCEARA